MALTMQIQITNSNITLLDRWSARFTEASNGCWNWIGPLQQPQKYGWFCFENKKLYAHRIPWILNQNGSLPRNRHVCHKCDIPWCVNPQHTFLASHLENMADMVAKGRCKRIYGERHGLAKLTYNSVNDIRNRYAAGVSMYSLAKEYGVSGTTVANVIRGKIWKLGDPIMVKG